MIRIYKDHDMDTSRDGERKKGGG